MLGDYNPARLMYQTLILSREGVMFVGKTKLTSEKSSRLLILLLGLQHTFTMFGATILVPILTGLDISVALFTAGLGTLLFNRITKNKIPVFLGSSFAYIATIKLASERYGMEYALGGIFCVGLVYLLVSLLIYRIGIEKVVKLLPSYVTYPLIIVIGLKLAPTAIGMAQENWIIAILCVAIMILISHYGKGFAKTIPVLITLIFGYILSLAFFELDFTQLDYRIFGLPNFTFPKFSLDAILLMLPISLVTILEHIGDIESISVVTGKDIKKEVGLHKTILGDGLATSLAALFGGPANTTYSENTGVLALTKVFNPAIMVVAGVFSIILSLSPFVASLLSSIPSAVIGGISIVLFGMIAGTGIRGMKEDSSPMTNKKVIISAIVLVLGIGIETIAIGPVNLTGMSLAVIAGIILNLILHENEKDKP